MCMCANGRRKGNRDVHIDGIYFSEVVCGRVTLIMKTNRLQGLIAQLVLLYFELKATRAHHIALIHLTVQGTTFI